MHHPSSSPSSRGSNIRDTIVASRKVRLRTRGHAQGLSLPDTRKAPLVPFSSSPLLICEIKRRSPSQGDIDPGLDPVKRARAYYQGGVRTFSILTEEEYFGGSLSDLVAVKSAYPEATVLRKDFLLDAEDIEVSYRFGADAVLLIASILDRERLEEMYRGAERLGLSVLVEAHTEEDVEKVRSIQPEWVGINARNLKTFRTDILHPLWVRRWIDWKAKVVFESGVRDPEDGWFVGSAGFEGLLVGEAVVRDPATVPNLRAAYEEAYGIAQEESFLKGCEPSKQSIGQPQFWIRIATALGRSPSSVYLQRPAQISDRSLKPKERRKNPNKGCKPPLVKVCGITNPSDAYLAVEAGADLLGFIFASSPRRAMPSLVRELRDLDVCKVGVVVVREGEEARMEDRSLLNEVFQLIQEGYLNAVQVHGMGDDRSFINLLRGKGIPFYPVCNIKTPKDLHISLEKPLGPRFLVDASKEGMYGGTGIRVSDEVLQVFQERGIPLWLAGGLRPESIRDVVEKWNPELVDVSSGVEAYPGKKDPEKLRKFFKEIQDACALVGR